MDNNWKIKIVDVGFKITREIFIFKKLSEGKVEMLNGDIIEVGSSYNKPAIELEPEQLQALADELDKIGYKPQKGFLEGKLVAMEKHLEDMRKLVFNN